MSDLTKMSCSSEIKKGHIGDVWLRGSTWLQYAAGQCHEHDLLA